MLLDRIYKKLASWKGNYVSTGSRLTIINSILMKLPLYLMSFFFLQQWIINRMDQVCWNFFGKDVGSRLGANAWFSWSALCSPCGYKGVGIKNLQNFNIALLAKWWLLVLTTNQVNRSNWPSR